MWLPRLTQPGRVGRRGSSLALLLTVCAALLAGCGGATRPRLTVGAVEDAARYSPDPGAKMRLAHAAGFRAVVLSARWTPTASAAADSVSLGAAARAAKSVDVEPVLAVYQLSGATPTTPASRASFAAYAADLARRLPEVRRILVGNEPNLNLFWQPQYGGDGTDAAATSYEALLAATYDALKGVDPTLTVVGGNLAPRGSDDPTSARQTHSPTRFIRDLGAALRASGRTAPLMDAFSLHVYGESPGVPPSLEHRHSTSLGIADYPKLVALLHEAFGGDLPIVYGEYGVESRIPAAKAPVYTGQEVVTPVDEATQARLYLQAIGLAACQERVQALYLFHVSDEPELSGLQSGLYYADDSPKTSLTQVRERIEQPRCAR